MALVAGASSRAQDEDLLRARLSGTHGAQRLEALCALVGAARDGDVPDVLELGGEAMGLLASHPDASLEVGLRLDLAWALAKAGDTAAALEHAQEARRLAEARGDLAAVALGDYHLSVAHWYRSELDEAELALGRAREAQTKLKLQLPLARTLTLEGALWRTRSDYVRSFECHMQALAIAERVDDAAAIARSRNNIGLIHWNLDQDTRALECLLTAASAYRSEENSQSLSAVLSNLGLLRVELGEPRKALEHLEEALELLDQDEDVRRYARVLSNMAYAHEQLDQLETAIELHHRAIELRRGLQDHWGLARSLGSLANVFESQESWVEAQELYEEGLEHARAAQARSEEASLLEGLSHCHEEFGRPALALKFMREHVALEDELARVESVRAVAEIEARAAIEAKQRELEALDGERARQELVLNRQRERQALLVFGSGLLGAAAIALWAMARSRTRSLKRVRANHEELQRSAARLRESEERYRGVFEDAVVPKLLVDLDARRILDANKPAARLCGLTPEELRDESLDEVQPAWLMEGWSDPERRLLEASGWTREWTDAGGDTHHVEVWATPLRLGNNACATVTVHDVTEAHRLEEERLRADKLDSLGLLAGGIAHDFNNAMASVLGQVSLARHRASSDVNVTPALEAAERAIDHATHLTGQLLTFARGGAPVRALEDVRKLLWDAVNFSLSGSNVRVSFDLDPDLWPAEVDAGQLRQVISNLVINANQAMAQGGRLVVRARNLAPGSGHDVGAGQGPQIAIEIQDDGPGIPAEIQDKVLDPYFTTKDEGTGLGLATAFAIVSRHGGRLDFHSEAGQGTTFTIHLPASTSRLPDRGSDHERAIGGSGSILVMDDEPLVQDVYRAALTELGYGVEIACDGQDAIERWCAAEDEGRPFDLVIMDLTIPDGMGGKQAMQELLARSPQALGIVASGYSKDPVMSSHREAGFQGALSKPFTITSLARLLDQVLSGRPSKSPSEGERHQT